MCKLTECVSVKLNSVSILFGIINSNKKFFQYTEHELINCTLLLEKEDLDRYSESNSVFFLFLLFLLLFIAIALTDTDILFEFNVTNR